MTTYDVRLDDRKVVEVTARDFLMKDVPHTFYCDRSQLCVGRERNPDLIHVGITNQTTGHYTRRHLKPEELPDSIRERFEGRYALREVQNATR